VTYDERGVDPVNLISVAGACSRSGKTALAETLLRTLEGRAAAVKFTTTDDVFERCPRGTPCVVCDIAVPYRVIDDPRVLDEAETDTARLGAAGARPVLWAIAKQNAVPAAWEAVCRRTSGAHAVVMEGSTIVDLARPRLCFFVVHPFLSPDRWKPTSTALLERADAVIVNLPRSEPRRPSPLVLAEIARFRGRSDVREGDVTRPLSEWAPDLIARLGIAS
jgi:molybdopterin-guanine dinucleotide biosynthesis protein